MKKLLKIIIVNIILLFIIFVGAELYCCYQYVGVSYTGSYQGMTVLQSVEACLDAMYRHYFKFGLNNHITNDEFREPIIQNSDKNAKNIIVAGGSFAHGCGYDNKLTLQSKLAKHLKDYNVYNIGLDGASPKETLYILRNYKKFVKDGFLPEEGDNTKYFIFIYIDDHHRRIVQEKYRRTPRFKVVEKDGEKHLEYYKSRNILKKSFIFRHYQYWHQFPIDEKINELFTLYIKDINNEVKKIYPSAEVIFFAYIIDDEQIPYDFKNVEDLGLTVIKLRDFSPIRFQKEYTFDGIHPNEKAWNEITPKFIEIAKIR